MLFVFLTRLGYLAKLPNNTRRKTKEITMVSRNAAKYEARAKILKAMAHPTRLFIVEELAKRGERCVCELTEQIGADMSTVSRHLTILKQAGIVEDEKRGVSVYYRLQMCCGLAFFKCVESVMQNNSRKQMKLLG
jgi:DNA-binding transcriptional ArsR family regulator